MNENPCSNQEIHVLFEHGSELENTLNEPCIIYGKPCGPDWSFRRCFCSRKRCVRLWHYDVRKYTADAILFGEIQCKKMGNLMFQQRFQYKFGWNKVKYARITITHVCVIALTLAGSLGRRLNTGPIGLVFKQHPRDQANVNAWKNMCDPYICNVLFGFLNERFNEGFKNLSETFRKYSTLI